MLFRNFWNTLRHNKTASILNILGLSVAFAAFAVIMMQVRYDLTYDKFHKNVDRIFRMEFYNPMMANALMSVSSFPVIELIEQSLPGIEAIGAIYANNSTENFKSTLSNIEYPFTIDRQQVTPGLFEVFDFNWAAGDASQFSEPNTVVIPQSQAERIFPHGPAVGQYLVSHRADSVQLRIIGVYYDFPQNSTLKNDLYIRTPNSNDRNWGSMQYIPFLRVKDPDNVEQLATQIGKTVGENQTGFFDEPKYRLINIRNTHYLTDVPYDHVEKINRSRTYLFLLVAILIVMIAMINFINFSIALVPSRLKNINTQKIFGCSEWRIRWVIWMEAIGICLIAALIAIWLVSFLSKTGFTNLLVAPIMWTANYPLLWMVIGTVLLTGLIAGIYPSFYLTSFPAALVIKGSFGLSPQGKRLRQGLISVQYTISLVLIIVALFIHAQNNYMKTTPIGFDRENLLQMQIPQSLASRFNMFRDQILQNPNIRDVAFSNTPIVAEEVGRHITNINGKSISYDYRVVSDSYDNTIGLKIINGRDLIAADTLKQESSLLFNETAQKQYGLQLGDRINNSEIVGFFSDINYKPLHVGIEPMAIEIRTTGSRTRFQYAFFRISGMDVRSTIAYINELVRKIEPNYTGDEMVFVDQHIGKRYEKEDKLALLITLFGLLAVVISLIGIYGLVMFEGRYRRKEIGIRRVHGATIKEILWMLNRNFIRIVLVCFVIAVPVAYYIIKLWLEEFAYKSPIHWWIFAVALLAVGVITVFLVTLQSYRAATENPINSIKTE
jgi:putative ABC transport system permease protein